MRRRNDTQMKQLILFRAMCMFMRGSWRLPQIDIRLWWRPAGTTASIPVFRVIFLPLLSRKDASEFSFFGPTFFVLTQFRSDVVWFPPSLLFCCYRSSGCEQSLSTMENSLWQFIFSLVFLSFVENEWEICFSLILPLLNFSFRPLCKHPSFMNIRSL